MNTLAERFVISETWLKFIYDLAHANTETRKKASRHLTDKISELPKNDNTPRYLCFTEPRDPKITEHALYFADYSVLTFDIENPERFRTKVENTEQTKKILLEAYKLLMPQIVLVRAARPDMELTAGYLPETGKLALCEFCEDGTETVPFATVNSSNNFALVKRH